MRTIRTGFALLAAIASTTVAQTQPTSRPDVTQITPSRITIDCENQPLAGVLTELAKQCGGEIENGFAAAHTPEPKLTLHLRDASFWQAADAISAAASTTITAPLSPNASWAIRPTTLAPTKYGDERSAFRLVEGFAQVSRIAPIRGGAGSARLSVDAELLVEPKVFLTEPAEFTLTGATDSAGNDLQLLPGRRPSTSVHQHSAKFSVPIALPDRPGDRVTTFEGTLRVGVATSVKSIRVDDLLAAGPLDYDIEGVSVHLETRREGEGFVLSGTMPLREGPAAAFEDLARRLIYPRVTDAKGTEIATTKTIVNDVKDGRQLIELRYELRAAKAPLSLRLDVPLGVRTVDVPIVLPGFPMP